MQNNQNESVYFLDSLEYESITNLTIQLGENKHGWLDIRLNSDKYKIEYTVSYLVDPWEQIIGNLISLLNGASSKYFDNQFIKKGFICGKHDLEGDSIYFLLNKLEDKLRLLILHNDIFETDIENMMSDNFNVKEYESTNYEDFPLNLSHIAFAFEDSYNNFIQYFIELIEKIRTVGIQNGFENSEEVWKYYIPTDYDYELKKHLVMR